MRIVLLCTAEHLGSHLVLNHLHLVPGVEIVGIVESSPVPVNRQGEIEIYKYIKKAGWYFSWMMVWQRIVQKAGFLVSLALSALTGKKYLVPLGTLAEEQKIPVFRGSLNSAAGEEFLRDLAPELIVSAYFNQILKPNIIATPKLGIVNIHPGLLPAYRGIMSYFWVLLNKEPRTGVSLHWIDAGIDTGQLIAMKSFRIGKNMTQQQILTKTAVIGAHMLKKFIAKLKNGHAIQPLAPPQEIAAYYPLPSHIDFNAYAARHRFFRIRDILGLMIRRLKLIR